MHNLPSNDAIYLPTSVKFGKGLSGWESEVEEGEFITEIVVGVAKSYSYQTNMKQQDKLGNVMVDKDGIAMNKIVIQQKGITMYVANLKNITCETLRDMVLTNTTLKSEDRYTFIWDSKPKHVIKQILSRSIRSTVNSKRTIYGFDTLPLGYEHEASNH